MMNVTFIWFQETPKSFSMNKTLIIPILLALSNIVFGQVQPDTVIIRLMAPDIFTVKFHTTKGDFLVEAHRTWSPEGVDRFYQLVKSGFYNNNSLFRVQKDYVVQFGISDDRVANEFWDKRPVHDESVRAANRKGMISYARDGAETRTAQLFINLKDNFKLDTVNYNGLRGFPPIATITEGFEVVETFYSGYGFEPANHQDSIMQMGNAYVHRHFPELDYIISAEIINK
jgi:peptidyl-prolyl cis-trans isomerase A (cyclophilin A)